MGPDGGCHAARNGCDSHVQPLALAALRQDGVDLAVVVVDDGSTDGTYDRLQAIDDPRLEVLRLSRNQGVSTARNAGLERASTEWVAFLDDDDAWAPSHLAGLLQAAQ